MDNNEDTFETRSVCSNSSHSIQHSSASAITARARAKAEAARAKASFAQKEADVMKAQAYVEEHQQKAAAEVARKNAELEASLHTLKLESEAAAAIAEVNVLEAAAENELGELDSTSLKNEYAEHSYIEHQDSKPPEPTATPMRQPTMDNGETAVNNVVEGKYESSEASNNELSYYDLPAHPTFEQEDDSTPYHPHAHTQNIPKIDSLKRERLHSSNPCSYGYRMRSHNIRQTSSSYQPHTHVGATPRTNKPSSSSTTDLAKYLIRREMISSGLLRFDDHPENYWTWKESFHSCTVDLNLTAREELDLLCKWLGPKSSEHAKRIRAVHIHDATAGVNMVWQRLEDCYGSPEAIENALLQKVDEFPRIPNRENQRLRELGDLLLELEAARADGFLPGLNYLDTSRGITPIVQKLPYFLHDKWVSVASHYKEKYHTSYPPFSFFAKFVFDQAKTLNDPSFAPLTGG